eukprot:NODE_7109_length_473_cov_7.188679_g6293_i0.p1 GENE.NODE_7109_length_473_cov_7.188679_g6293_i0~~NODE_7109_length_473_cov_7.188679_g6293_i0.p1  ORF type:complete len:154 (-),score=26.77 NODE_7109_length_473_cov_7.188679_g6293_i0:11-406(-)
MSVFRKFVEPGRVAYKNYARELHQLIVILEIVDHQRVLVQPLEGSDFRYIEFVKNFDLTEMVLKVNQNSTKDEVKEAVKEANVFEKFKETTVYKVEKQREMRRNLTDFERFKVRKFKKLRANLLKKAVEAK